MKTAASDQSSLPPSEFLKRGFPSGSVCGEYWHEVAAVTYLYALVLAGDTWQTLTPDQVVDVMQKQGADKGDTARRDRHRLAAVSAKLRSAEDARNFSWKWRKAPQRQKAERLRPVNGAPLQPKTNK